jgi:hypothetical protein
MRLRTLFRRTPPETHPTGVQESSHTNWRQESYATWRQARYLRWREASDAVAESYRSWAAAPLGERFLAHAAYLEALQREENAARSYQRLVEQGLRAVDEGAGW